MGPACIGLDHAQRLGEGVGALGPHARVLGQSGFQEVGERNGYGSDGRARGGVPQYAEYDRSGGLSVVGGEGAASQRQLVHRRRQAVDIGRRGHGPAFEHLRGRMKGREAEDPLRRLCRRLQGGDPEVGQHGLAELGDEYVLRLHVPVQQARTVSGLERSSDFDADPGDLDWGQRPALAHALSQGLPAELEYQDGTALGTEEGAVQRGDIGMVAEQGKRSHLLVEHLRHVRRLVRQAQDLQGHRASGAELGGAVDSGERAGGDLRQVGVPRERDGAGAGGRALASSHAGSSVLGREGPGPTVSSERALSPRLTRPRSWR